jgi:uracil-DNA glycosylase family 4
MTILVLLLLANNQTVKISLKTSFFPLSDVQNILSWLQDAGVTEWVDDIPNKPLAKYETQAPAKPLTKQAFSAPLAVSAPVGAGTSPSVAPGQWGSVIADLSDRQALNDWISGFRELSLCRTATQAVLGRFLAGDGAAKPALMVIAEAPDAHEDQSGQGFSGPAHDLLRQALTYTPMPAERIYMTYLSKWRPPGQRSLSLPELELAQILLQREIALVGPAHVITLGEVVPRAMAKITEHWTAQTPSSDSITDTPRVPAGGRARGSVEKIYAFGFKGLNSEKRALSLQKAETMLKDALTKKRVWQNLLSFCQALPTS